MVIPAAHARGMKVYVELMEPFFKYAGHGSAAAVEIPTLPQAMEVDAMGRLGGEPSTSNPGYRTWIHSMIEDQVRNHDIDGLMWCNERNSPLDTLIQGGCPGDFSRPAARRGAGARDRRGGVPPRLPRHVRLHAGGRGGQGLRRRRVHHLPPHAARQPRIPRLGEVLARTQQGPRPRALRPREVVQAQAAVRPQRLEPQPFQHLPPRPVAVGRTDELRRLREAHHLPASGGRGLGEGTGLLPQDDPARLRTGRGDDRALPHPRAERSAVGEPRRRRHGPRHLCRGPVRRRGAEASRARPRSTWASASTRPAPAPTRRR